MYKLVMTMLKLPYITRNLHGIEGWVDAAASGFNGDGKGSCIGHGLVAGFRKRLHADALKSMF